MYSMGGRGFMNEQFYRRKNDMAHLWSLDDGRRFLLYSDAKWIKATKNDFERAVTGIWEEYEKYKERKEREEQRKKDEKRKAWEEQRTKCKERREKRAADAVRLKGTTTLHQAGENSDKRRRVSVGVEEQSHDSSRSIAVSDPDETGVGANSKAEHSNAGGTAHTDTGVAPEFSGWPEAGVEEVEEPPVL
jgi:hypothetical protein